MRTYQKFMYVSLLLLLVGAFFLNHSRASGAMPAVTVTEKDNHGTVEINKGDLLAVVLKFSPGTGYSWQVAKNDPKLTEPQGGPVTSPEAGKESMPGASEQATFLFKAVNSGTAVMEFRHIRPWEKEKEPQGVFSITVKIQ